MDALKAIGGLTLICIVGGLVIGFGYLGIERWLGEKKFERLKDLISQYTPVVLGVFAFMLIVFLAAKYIFGTNQPGTLLEKSSYTAKVYVLVFPDSKSSVNYYLPADVTKDSGYTITQVYWPDGGYLTFGDGCEVTFNKKTQCTPDNTPQAEALQRDFNASSPNLPSNFINRALSLPTYNILLTSNKAP